MTSYCVFMGIKASLAFATNNNSLDGRKIAIQGLGNVGIRLAERLYNAGAKLIITDI